MDFLTRHRLTSPAAEVAAVVHYLGAEPHLLAGAYDDGLITLVAADTAEGLLSTRQPLAGDFISLVTTAFGDLYAWSRSREAVYYLNVQYGTATFLDPEIAWVLDVAFANAELFEAVFDPSRFARLKNQHRPLEYHEAFLLKLPLMFGGADSDDNYGIGKCWTYLNIMGQSRGGAPVEFD